MIPNDMSTTSWTPPQLAKLLHVSPEKVRNWIKTGQLGAVNVASDLCRRPSFVILEHHLAEFEQKRSSKQTPKPKRRKRTKQKGFVDFFPD